MPIPGGVITIACPRCNGGGRKLQYGELILCDVCEGEGIVPGVIRTWWYRNLLGEIVEDMRQIVPDIPIPEEPWPLPTTTSPPT